MELSNDLRCLFTAQIEIRDGDPVVTVPERELSLGELEAGGSYRVAVFATASAEGAATDSPTHLTPDQDIPVSDGDHIEVEIEDLGDQGDGIARVGPGYIVFVPDTELGDRVTVEITDTRENFAFGEVIEDEPIA